MVRPNILQFFNIVPNMTYMTYYMYMYLPEISVYILYTMLLYIFQNAMI